MQPSFFTFETLWHVKSSIPALRPHDITAVSGFVYAVNGDHFVVQNSVGLQVFDPNFFVFVQDSSSFYGYVARSCES